MNILTIVTGIVAVSVLIWALKSLDIFQDTSVPFWLLVSLFGVKVVFAILNYYYFATYLHHGDALGYNRECYTICTKLYSDPQAFFREWTDWGAKPSGWDILSRDTRFWEQLGFNIHRRILIFLNLISLGQPFVVAIWFSFISFLGQWYLFKSFRRFFPYREMLLLIPIFFTPLVLFWSAGISKEAYMILSIGLVIYSLVSVREKKKGMFWSFLVLLLSLLMLFCVRNFYFLSLIPFLVLWQLTYKLNNKYSPLLYIGLMLLTLGALYYVAQEPSRPGHILYQRIIDRQEDFALLKGGGTDVPTVKLDSTGHNLPAAISTSLNHIFLRPYFTEVKKKVQALAFVDTYLFLVFALFVLLVSHYRNYFSSFFWFIFTFSMSNLIMIGMVVPNLGAISRYKMVFILLLATAVMGIFTQRFAKRRFENQ